LRGALRYERRMRNLVTTVLLAVISLAAGCGAGRGAVEARAARYRGDKLVLFGAMKAATEAKYKLDASDETSLRITTKGRWYAPDGLGASERQNDMRDVPDRSVYLRLIVELAPDGSDWAVSVKPVMMRYFAGRPNPDHLTPDDPSVPGWATGRVDKLRAAIHEALQSYQVKSPGTATASPQAEPAPTSDKEAATQVLPR
jgi:hypothetical protein